jgi:hypothetical protein
VIIRDYETDNSVEKKIFNASQKNRQIGKMKVIQKFTKLQLRIFQLGPIFSGRSEKLESVEIRDGE